MRFVQEEMSYPEGQQLKTYFLDVNVDMSMFEAEESIPSNNHAETKLWIVRRRRSGTGH